MAESPEFLQTYRDNMDLPMEILASTLAELGWAGEGCTDAEAVETATRKLRTLHRMLLSTGMNPDLLKAIMTE